MQELGPLQKEWLELLESGEFKQGNSYLHTRDERDGDKYCCLGIAVEKVCNILPTSTQDCVYIFIGHSGSMPPDAVEIMKFYTCTGTPKDQMNLTFDKRDQGKINSKDLSYLNDYGSTFKEIADLVRNDPSMFFSEPA